MEYKIHRTEKFDKWLKKLKDVPAKMIILNRIDRARLGNFGDYKSVGGGVSEMRIAIGPGYRLYYTIRENKIVFMLQGGAKRTQTKDVKKAQKQALKI